MSSSSRASSVTLVGMPGAGKSTVGVLVAKALALDFIDSDLAIQRACGRTLQSYMDERGHLALRQLEEAVICRLDPTEAVVATGGSAIYSDHAMAHLAGAGCVVFLQVTLPIVKARIGDFGQRGIVECQTRSRCLSCSRSAMRSTGDGQISCFQQMSNKSSLLMPWSPVCSSGGRVRFEYELVRMC